MASRLRVCVVGSGPGGLYTTKYILKQLAGVRVDVFEALPTPYGLVRSGVAPDHPEVKSVQNDFDSVMSDSRVKYYGNVKVGKDVAVTDLRKNYDAMVFSYGASFDRSLGIPGEDAFGNVFGARTFVNWYNGHPEFKDFAPDLTGETAIVVGQGNVAIDCARILTKDIDELAKTDIAEHAIEALAKSNVKNVKVVGRRGHVQAAFTMKELRELTKLDGVGCVVDPVELQLGLTEASMEEVEKTRPKKRMNDLLKKVADKFEKERKKERTVELKFLLSPTEVLGNDGKVESVVFERNKLEGPAFKQSAVPTGELETHDCSLLLRSIGYKSLPLEGVPFDSKRNVAANIGGRIIEGNSSGLASMYTSGWLKRGPSGIIGTNINDAKETVSAILEDAEAGKLPVHINESEAELENRVDELLKDCDVVDWEGYLKIEAIENKRGDESNPSKPRQKIVDIKEMLHHAI